MSAHINIPKYKLSPNEVDSLLKEEWERRKKLRIVQVRHQSRENAADIRNAVKKEKDHQYQLLMEQIQSDFNEEKENCLQDLQSEYQHNLQKIGESHFLAQQQDESNTAREMQNIENTMKAKHRHKQALNKLKEENSHKQVQTQRHIIDRRTALEVEATRTALVVNLPTSKVDLTNKNDKRVAGPKVQMQDINVLVPTFYQMPEKFVVREEVKSELDARKMAEFEEQKLTQKSKRPDKSQERFKEALHKDRLNKECKDVLQELNVLALEDRMNRQQEFKRHLALFKPSVKVKETNVVQQEDVEKAFEQLLLDNQDKIVENQIPYIKPSDVSVQPEQPSNLDIPVSDQPVKEQPEKKNQQSVVIFNNLIERIQQQKEEWLATTNKDSPELESASLVAEPKSAELGITPKSDEMPSDLTSSSITSTVYLELPDKPSISEQFKEKYFDDAQVFYKMKTTPGLPSDHRQLTTAKDFIKKSDDAEILSGDKEPLMKSIPRRKLVMTTEGSSASWVDYKEKRNIFQGAEDQLELFRQHNELLKNYHQKIVLQKQQEINTPPTKSQLSEIEVPTIKVSSTRNLPSHNNNERILAYQRQLLQRHHIKELMRTTISQPSAPQFFPRLSENMEMGQGDTGDQSEINQSCGSQDDLRRPYRIGNQSETNQPDMSNDKRPHRTLSENEVNLTVDNSNKTEIENRTQSWSSHLKLLQAQSSEDAIPPPRRHLRPPITARTFFENLPPHELSTIIEMDTPNSLMESSDMSNQTSISSSNSSYQSACSNTSNKDTAIKSCDVNNSSRSSMSSGSFHDLQTSVEAAAENLDKPTSNSLLVKPIESRMLKDLNITPRIHHLDKFVFKEFNVQMTDQKYFQTIHKSSDNLKHLPQSFQKMKTSVVSQIPLIIKTPSSDKILNNVCHSAVDYSPLLSGAKLPSESDHTPSSDSQLTDKTLTPLSSGTLSSQKSRTITSTLSNDKTISSASQYSFSSANSLTQLPLDSVAFHKPSSNNISHSLTTSKGSLTDSNCINFSASTALTFLSNSALSDHRMATSWSQSSINSGVSHQQVLPAPKLQQQQLQLTKVHSTPLKLTGHKLDISELTQGILEESDLTLVNSTLDVTQYPMKSLSSDQPQVLLSADSTKMTNQFRNLPSDESASQSLLSFQSHEQSVQEDTLSEQSVQEDTLSESLISFQRHETSIMSKPKSSIPTLEKKKDVPSLQKALQMRRPKFMRRSQDRVKQVKTKAQQNREEADERMAHLLKSWKQQRVLTEKIEVTPKSSPMIVAPSPLSKNQKMTNYQRSLRLYNQLEEVHHKQIQKERVQKYSLYREKAKIFQRKTLEKVLKKKT